MRTVAAIAAASTIAASAPIAPAQVSLITNPDGSYQGSIGAFGVPKFDRARAADVASISLTTLPGTTYALSFDLIVIGSWDGNSGRGFSRDTFSITADGLSVFSSTYEANRASRNFITPDASGRLADLRRAPFIRFDGLLTSFTAADGLTDLRFIVNTTGRDEGVALDNIRITPIQAITIPSPAGGLALAGLGAAQLFRRRRNA